MTLQGTSHENTPKIICFEINADAGDGLYIPCVPAIFLTEKIAANAIIPKGAMPCAGVITLDEYMATLKKLQLKITYKQTVVFSF